MAAVGFSLATSPVIAQTLPDTTPPRNAEDLELLQAEILDTVLVDRPIHFLTPQTADIVLPPGTYRVRESDANEMKLISVKDHKTTLISVLSGFHQVALSTPIALHVRPDDNISHILLMLPNGQTLEAVGPSDATRTRGIQSPRLTPGQIQKALSQKLQKVKKQ